MIKVFIYNILCVIAVVIFLVAMGTTRDTNSSYAVGGMILIIIVDIIGNIALTYQSE